MQPYQYTDLNKGRIERDARRRRLKTRHISKYLLHAQVVDVHDAERRHIDEVVFEVLQIERLDVERREEIVIFIIVHLQL